MQLSLWQQFSSNHSAFFDIVGTFNSQETANQAADEVRKILDELRHWWVNSAESLPFRTSRTGDETTELTPIELQLKQKYQIEWPFSINWYMWQWDYDQSPVSVFENVVFLRSPHPYIWHGPQPFDSLFEQLGAKVSFLVSESRSHVDEALFLDIECQLPVDKLSAELLYERFKKVFEAIRNTYESGDPFKSHLKFPFNYDIVQWKYVDEHVRVYEVDMVNNRLKLYGLDIGEVYTIAEGLSKFIDYLKQEGCTDISFSFHSSPIVR